LGHNGAVVTASIDTRPHRAGSRVGYVIAVVVNAALLIVINVRPGWHSFDFLTDAFAEVLPIVNLSLVVGMVVNAAYLAFNPRWFRSLGQLLMSIVGLVVAWRLLVVFPFEPEAGWDALARSLLVLALLGSGVGVLVSLVHLVRGSAR